MKPIVAVLGLVIACFLVLFCISLSYEMREREEQAAIEQERINSMISDLTQRRSEIFFDLTNLELSTDEDIQNRMASLILIVSEPTEYAETVIIPHIELFSYKPVVAVSETLFPGDSGCMTVEFIQEKGYDICLLANGSTDLEALFNKCIRYGLPSPKAVYYAYGGCPDEHVQVIKDLGMSIICEYWNAESALGSSQGLMSVTVGGSYEVHSPSILSNLSINAGTAAIVIGASDYREKYAMGNIEKMLNKIISYYDPADNFDVCSFDEALERHVMTSDYDRKRAAEKEETRARLETELERIDGQLRSLVSTED